MGYETALTLQLKRRIAGLQAQNAELVQACRNLIDSITAVGMTEDDDLEPFFIEPVKQARAVIAKGGSDG